MKILLRFNIHIFSLFIFSLLATEGCKKDGGDADGVKPEVTTGQATDIGRGWASMNGYIVPNDLIVLPFFEYGTTTSYGSIVSAIPDTIDSGSGTGVTIPLEGLSPKSTYNYRLLAVTGKDTVKGENAEFTTTDTSANPVKLNPGLVYGKVTDRDGNMYNTVKIGTRVWMAENLRTTKFSDGEPIPFVPQYTVWAVLTTPAYCWYNSDSLDYGALYNWQTVKHGKLCPDGWHVPDESDWADLLSAAGGESVAAPALRESGQRHWLAPNSSSTNATGFSAVPGGYRTSIGTYSNIKRYGYWWSSTESSSALADCRYIFYNFNDVAKSTSNKNSAMSVKCVKTEN